METCNHFAVSITMDWCKEEEGQLRKRGCKGEQLTATNMAPLSLCCCGFGFPWWRRERKVWPFPAHRGGLYQIGEGREGFTVIFSGGSPYCMRIRLMVWSYLILLIQVSELTPPKMVVIIFRVNSALKRCSFSGANLETLIRGQCLFVAGDQGEGARGGRLLSGMTELSVSLVCRERLIIFPLPQSATPHANQSNEG